MLLGIEVGLAPGDIVLDGDPAPPKRGTAALPHFSAVLWPNGWVDQDPTWYEGRPRPGNIVFDADPAPPPRGRARNFRPMSVVAKRLDGSRCHLVRRSASAQATLCYMGIQILPIRGTAPPPIFGPYVYCGQKDAHLSYC